MKITILSENLQKALSLVNHAISSRNQLPILSHVLLSANGGFVTLSATDLEIGIEVSFAASIEEEGATTVPAKLFLELANSLPSGKIMVSTEEGTLLVTSAHTKSKLQTTPAEEFPKLYETKGNKILSLSGNTLQGTLRRILFTASAESTRPALSGILFKGEEEGLLLVATDGYRLSLEKIQGVETGFEGTIIVPIKLAKEVMSLKEDATIDVFIDKGHNQIVFSQGDTVLVGRLIDAEFPNYDKILPTDASTTVVVDKDSLLRAVKACAVFAREAAQVITFTIGEKSLAVSSKTPSLGENVVDVEIALSGEENAIAFNAKYLLDFLSVVDAEEVRFEMTGPLNSGVFRLVGNNIYLHLIMPIRTQG